MADDSMNGTDLSRILAAQVDLPVSKAKVVVNALFDIIADELAAGHKVLVTGFGTMQTVARVGRQYRDLHTGKVKTSPAKRVVTFKPGVQLTRRLNPGFMS